MHTMGLWFDRFQLCVHAMNDLALDGLATYRLVRLLHDDKITEEARIAVIAWTLRNGHTRLRYLIQCPFCLSIWAAGAVLLLRRTPLRDLLAAAGVASVLYELLEPSAN